MSLKLKDRVNTSMWKKECVSVNYSEVLEMNLLPFFFKINEVILAFLKLKFTVMDFSLSIGVPCK